MDKYLEALKYLIGYGDPQKARLFLFAKEENGNLVDDYNDNLENKRIEYLINTYNNRRQYYSINCSEMYSQLPIQIKEKDLQQGLSSKVYQCYNKIYSSITKDKCELVKFLKIMGTEDMPDLFWGNIDFMPRTSSGSEYDNEMEDYARKNWRERDDILHSFFKSYNLYSPEKVVVFLGLPHGNFLKINSNNDWIQIEDFPIYRHSEHDNLYKAGHPSRNKLSIGNQLNLIRIILSNHNIFNNY